MGVKRFRFIGHEEEVSDQLPLLVTHLQLFDGFTTRLTKVLLMQMEKEHDTDLSMPTLDEWDAPLKSIAREILEHGKGYGVYDLTMQELLDENEGISRLRQIYNEPDFVFSREARENTNTALEPCRQVETEFLEAMGQDLALFSGSRKEAEKRQPKERQNLPSFTREKPFKAPPFLCADLFFQAMDQNALKKKYAKTCQEDPCLRKDPSCQEGGGERKGQSRLFTGSYYADCSQAISALLLHMWSLYLGRLKEAGSFHPEEIPGYDLPASEKILKNLAWATDRRKELISAFEACPYHLEVYKELLRQELADVQSFEAAKYLHLSAALLPSLQRYAHKRTGLGRDPSQAVQIWASLEERQQRDIYRELYGEICAKAWEKYQEVLRAIRDRGECVQWIRDHLTEKATQLVKSMGELKSLTENQVKGILSPVAYQKGAEFHLFEAQRLTSPGVDALCYELVMEDLSARLYAQVLLLARSQEKRISELSETLLLMENEEQNLQEQARSLEEGFLKQIEDLKEKRKSCGLFCLRKKNALDRAISELQIKRDLALQEQKQALDCLAREKKLLQVRMEALL